MKRRSTPRTWDTAKTLVSSGRMSWQWRYSASEVSAEGSVPTQNRSPFQVTVTWTGGSLRTRCTCPARRGHLCSHRVALGMLLHSAMTHARAKASSGSAPPAVASGPVARPAAAAPAQTSVSIPTAPPRTSAPPATTGSNIHPTPAPGGPTAPAGPAALWRLHPRAGRSAGQIALEALLRQPDGSFLVLPGGTFTALFRKFPRLPQSVIDLLARIGVPAKSGGSARRQPKTSRRLIPPGLLQSVLESFFAGHHRVASSSPLQLIPGRVRIKLELAPTSRTHVHLRAFLDPPLEGIRPSDLVLLGGAGCRVFRARDRLLLADVSFPPKIWNGLRRGLRIGRIEVRNLLRSLDLPDDAVVDAADSTSAPVFRYLRKAVPRPALVLQQEGRRLRAHLEFRYTPDAPRIPAALDGSETRIDTPTTTFVVTRDRSREHQAENLLLELGLERAGAGTFTCRPDALPQFVYEALPQLRDKGWEIDGEEILQTLSPTPLELELGVQIRRRIDWFSFAMTAEAGDVRIPVRELVTAWKTGRRYLAVPPDRVVRVPVEWLELNAELLEALEALPSDDDGVKVSACHAPLAGAVADLSARSDIDPGFMALRRRIDGILDETPRPLPSGLRATLRPYQEAGYTWLSRLLELELGGLLADDMGLGKTLQVLAVLLAAREAAKAATETGTATGMVASSLIVAPTSVLENWANEAARFTPVLRTVVFHGTDRHTAVELDDADLVITSYALLRRDLELHLARTYQHVVFDEAQAFKNPASDTARACREVRARHRIALTGTPVENRLSELWSIFAAVMPELLGSQSAFQSRYAGPIEREGRASRREELRRRISPFILRRLKEDVAPDLPSLTESVLYCDLEPDQAALYQTTLQACRRQVFEAVDAQGIERSRFTVFEALLKLRQICCHPPLSKLDRDGLVRGSAKLSLFRETLEEILESGHRVLVFSQFVEMLQVLKEGLEQAATPFLYLDGSTRDRQALVDRYNQTDIPVFLISLKAGGAGLNLTGADYVIHYDPWWNPAVEAQATGRAHRIGQTRPVFSYRLISRGTVEERMLELHDRKRALADALLEDDGSLGRLLTREDLEILFSGNELATE